MKSQENQPNGV